MLAKFLGNFGVSRTPTDVEKQEMVPRRGLEPPRLAAQVPETCASTNSAIWATESDVRGWLVTVNWVFEVFLTVCKKQPVTCAGAAEEQA